MTKKTYQRGNTTIIYITEKKPGHTTMDVTWNNPVKAEKYRETQLRKAKREEAKKNRAAAAKARRMPSSRSKKFKK